MRMQIADLHGPALDWAVAKAVLGQNFKYVESFGHYIVLDDPGGHRTYLNYSTDWSQGGPIIDLARLCVGHNHDGTSSTPDCWARPRNGGCLSYGPTALIAAMRCFVWCELGYADGEIDVPEELIIIPALMENSGE